VPRPLLADSILAAAIVLTVITGVAWVAAMLSLASSRDRHVQPPRDAGSGIACWYSEP
jgi:hypothetical protein